MSGGLFCGRGVLLTVALLPVWIATGCRTDAVPQQRRLLASASVATSLSRKPPTTIEMAGKASMAVPTLRVPRIPTGAQVVIDGRFDDEAWATAAKSSLFVRAQSGEEVPEDGVGGVVRLLWDDGAFYVAFEVRDHDVVGGFPADAIDPHLWTRDTVEVMIDPDGDGDNLDYYEIQINPQNLIFDSRFDSYNRPRGGPNGPFGHQDWTAKLESAVVIAGSLDQPARDQGYAVEIRIPWLSLSSAKRSPPLVGDMWRMNFYAMELNGGSAWSPILGQGNFHKASRFGRVIWAN